MKKTDIEHIANLAKLALKDEEIEKFASELSPVLQHFEQLSQFSTDACAPLITPTNIEYSLREDKVEKLIASDDAVANAPEKVGHLFKVPPVV